MNEEDAQVERVISLMRLRRVDDAITAGREGLARWPDSTDLHRLLAVCLSERGEPEQALEHADAALHLSPDRPYTLMTAGAVRSALGQHPDALRLLDDATRLDPLDPMVAKRRVDALIAWALDLPRSARGNLLTSAYDGALELSRIAPSDPAGPFLAAKVSLLRGRIPAAEHHLAEGLALDPADARLHQIRGIIAQRQGRRQEALDAFFESGRLDPTMEGTAYLVHRTESMRVHPIVHAKLQVERVRTRVTTRWQRVRGHGRG